MKPLKLRRTQPKTEDAEADRQINELVDTALNLLDELRTTTDRVGDILSRTKQVSKQYAGTLKPKTNGNDPDDNS